MLFQVAMTVNPPKDMPVEQFDALKLNEKEYSQNLQRQGVWCHIWRVAGQYANISIFDVKDNAHLHDVLMGLPLYPYMDVVVTPLCTHPSAVK